MVRKLLGLVVLVVVARIAMGGGAGVAVGWLLELYVLLRAAPAIRADLGLVGRIGRRTRTDAF